LTQYEAKSTNIGEIWHSNNIRKKREIRNKKQELTSNKRLVKSNKRLGTRNMRIVKSVSVYSETQSRTGKQQVSGAKN